MAPVARLAVLESFGRAEEDLAVELARMVWVFAWATVWRRALRLVK